MSPDTFKAGIAEVETHVADAYNLCITFVSGQRLKGAWGELDQTDEAIFVVDRHSRTHIVPLSSILTMFAEDG